MRLFFKFIAVFLSLSLQIFSQEDLQYVKVEVASIIWKNQNTNESFPKVRDYALASEILNLEITKEWFETFGDEDLDNTMSYFADEVFSNVTISSVRGALIFNDTATGDPSVAVLDFGADKAASSGDFTIVFPTADASNAIIRIA